MTNFYSPDLGAGRAAEPVDARRKARVDGVAVLLTSGARSSRHKVPLLIFQEWYSMMSKIMLRGVFCPAPDSLVRRP